MSVSGMEQKLAELLLLSNSPDIDAGRIMAAAGVWVLGSSPASRLHFQLPHLAHSLLHAASLKRDADVVLQDPSLTLLQRTAFR